MIDNIFLRVIDRYRAYVSERDEIWFMCVYSEIEKCIFLRYIDSLYL